QVTGALRDSREHRLQVGRRAADHAQDLRHRRLLFQRLSQVALQVRIGRRGRRFLLRMLSRCSASRAELSVCYRVGLLAPGTLHEEAPVDGAGRWAGRKEPDRMTASTTRAFALSAALRARGLDLLVVVVAAASGTAACGRAAPRLAAFLRDGGASARRRAIV